MPKVLNKYKDGVPAGAVYIGRPSKWGNPFVIGKDGDREEVIAKCWRNPLRLRRRNANWPAKTWFVFAHRKAATATCSLRWLTLLGLRRKI